MIVHDVALPSFTIPTSQFIGVAFCYTSCDGRSTREKKMRQAFMSIQRRTNTYSKDMKLREYFEPWDRGACRRR
jgi:hypothetical protein